MILGYDLYLKFGQQQIELFAAAVGASARIWSASVTKAMETVAEFARGAKICALHGPASTNIDVLTAAQKQYFDALKDAIVRPGMDETRLLKQTEKHHESLHAPVARAARGAVARL